MGLLTRIRDRRRDMATLTTVLQTAEGHARAAGDDALAAHHLLLAAFDMADGTAAQAFEVVGADPADFAPAIETQHADALRTIGLDLSGADADADADAGAARPSSDGLRLMRSDATFEAALTGTRERHLASGGQLLGRHIVAAVASVEHGVAARALETMGIDRRDLATAAEGSGRA